MAVHRPTLFNLMNSIMGVSVLSIPFCFYQCGVVLGSLAMILMMYFTKKTCSFLLIASQIGRRRSYESLAQYTYGNTGKLGVEACIIGLTFGTLCAFNVIIGDLGPSIAQNLFSIEITPSIRAIIMIILAFGVGLPLSLMRDISALSSTSALSILFYGIFVTQVTFKSLPQFFTWEWMNKINFWRPAGLLQSLPIFSLSFSCQPQLFGLYDSLPEPSIKKMESVVSVGMHIVSTVYLSVGFFSYVSFYDVGVRGDILTNYGSSFVAELLKLGFSMSVIVSFPLMVFPMRASINSLLFPSQTAGTENMPGGPGYMPQNRFVYITVTVITLALMVGILIPQIEVVLGLTGATMGILITMILPASMFLHAVQETKGELRNVAKAVLIIGFVFLIGSTYAVLSSSDISHQENIKPVVQPPKIKPTFELQNPDIIKPIIKSLPNVSGPIKPIDPIKPIQAVPTASIAVDLGKVDESKESKGKGKDMDEKRKEPVLPHPPDIKDDVAVKQNKEAGPLVKGAADFLKGKNQLVIDDKAKGIDKAEKVADPVNEKRQLMSADDIKGNDPVVPQQAALKVTSRLDAEKQSSDKKQVDNNLVNNSIGLDSKALKKPESREKRHLDDNLEENKTGNGIDKESGTETPSTPSKSSITTKAKATPETNNVIIVKPTLPTSSGQTSSKRTTTESSSLDTGHSDGKVVKGRDLKSQDVTSRKLKSALHSAWEKRIKRAGHNKAYLS